MNLSRCVKILRVSPQALLLPWYAPLAENTREFYSVFSGGIPRDARLVSVSMIHSPGGNVEFIYLLQSASFSEVPAGEDPPDMIISLQTEVVPA